MKRVTLLALTILMLINLVPVTVFAADSIPSGFTKFATFYYDDSNPGNQVHGNAKYAYDCYVGPEQTPDGGPQYFFMRNGRIVTNQKVVSALTKMYFAHNWKSYPLAVGSVETAKEFIEIVNDYKATKFLDGLTTVASKCLGSLASVYLTGGTATAAQITKIVATQTVDELQDRFLDISNVISELHIAAMYMAADEMENCLNEIRNMDSKQFIHYSYCERFANIFSTLQRLTNAESQLVSEAIKELNPSLIGNLTKYFSIAANSFVGGFADVLQSASKIAELKKNNPEFIADAIDLAVRANKLKDSLNVLEDLKALSESTDNQLKAMFSVFQAYETFNNEAYTTLHVIEALHAVTISTHFPQALPANKTATIEDGIYNIKTAAGDRMMNVYAGKNADETNVVTWEKDGTVDQKFYVKHVSNGKYLIYAVCSASSGGYTRCLDIYTGDANKLPKSGDNVDIYTRNKLWNNAQYFYIEPTDDGAYILECCSVAGLVITASNPAKNNGNVCVSTYTGNNNQKWVFTPASNDSSSQPSSGNGVDLTAFNQKLSQFKRNKYAHKSTYVNNPNLTGGYECFGFANELARYIFGSYPTKSMSAKTVNKGWTVTYGGKAVDNLCVGDIVRYKYHSIFITKIEGDTVYYCQANVPMGSNRVTYDNHMTLAELRALVQAKLTSPGTTKQGWVAHFDASQIKNDYVETETDVETEVDTEINTEVDTEVTTGYDETTGYEEPDSSEAETEIGSATESDTASSAAPGAVLNINCYNVIPASTVLLIMALPLAALLFKKKEQ